MAENNAIIVCPVCDWTHERELIKYEQSNKKNAPAVARVMGISSEGLLSIHRNQAMHRDEIAVENHLKTHTPHEWLPVLMRHKNRADQAGAPPDGQEPIRTIQLNQWNLEAVAEDTEFTESELRDILISARSEGRSVRIRISGLQW